MPILPYRTWTIAEMMVYHCTDWVSAGDNMPTLSERWDIIKKTVVSWEVSMGFLSCYTNRLQVG